MIFITFLHDTKLLEIKYEEMVNVLKQKYLIEKFLIILFTTEQKIDKIIPPEYEIITIDHFFDNIWRKKEERIPLYKDIYTKFLNVISKYGLNYKSFEEQFDIKNMPVIQGVN
jgi:hypothetical protein